MIETQKLKYMFDEAYEGERESLDELELHEKYYHGEQLPDDVIAELKNRGQPPHQENIYQKQGNKILGFRISTRHEIKVMGRQRNDFLKSEILTDILRSINDSTSYNFHKKKSDLDLLLGKTIMEPFVRYTGEKDAVGRRCKEIVVRRIPPLSFISDPFSELLDSSDARYHHRVFYLDEDEFCAYFGKENLDSVTSATTTSSGYRRRIKVIETWFSQVECGEKRWYRAFWHRDHLMRCEKSPYLHGSHPYAIRKMYIDHENRYYGIFRNIKPLQDSINYGRNRLNNMLGSLKLLYEHNAVDDPEIFADEFSKDNAIVGVNNGALTEKRMEVVKHNAEIAQLSEIMMDDRRTADVLTGLNEEMMGMAKNRLSGSAIERRQNVAIMSLEQFLDASIEVDKQAFSKAISLVQQFFDAEQIFKIVEADKSERYFSINKLEKTKSGKIVYEGGKPKRTNKIEAGRYDLVLRVVPETQGSAQERYKQGVELLKLLGQAAPELVKPMVPLLLQDIESPIAQQAQDLIKKMQEQGQNVSAEEQAMKAMQIEAQKMQLEKLKGEVGMNKAKSLKLVAEAQEEASRADLQGASLQR